MYKKSLYLLAFGKLDSTVIVNIFRHLRNGLAYKDARVSLLSKKIYRICSSFSHSIVLQNLNFV